MSNVAIGNRPPIHAGMRVRIRAGEHAGKIGTLKERAGLTFVVRTDCGLVNVPHRMLLERLNLDETPYRPYQGATHRDRVVSELRRDWLPQSDRDLPGRRPGSGCDALHVPGGEADARPARQGRGAEDEGRREARGEERRAQIRLDQIAEEGGGGATSGSADARGPLALVRALERWWAMRECFICGRRAKCSHREIEADLAEVDRLTMRAQKAANVGLALAKAQAREEAGGIAL